MIEINVCVGTSCHLNGSYNVVQTFEQLIEEHSLHEEIEFKANFCLKHCQNQGVSVTVNGQDYRVVPEKAIEFFNNIILAHKHLQV